jgi:chaperonin cofactor prefoldin
LQALQEQAKQEASLLQQLQSLDKAKKQYEKSFKDGEKSVENYKRIDADQSFPRIDVEKVNLIDCLNLFET